MLSPKKKALHTGLGITALSLGALGTAPQGVEAAPLKSDTISTKSGPIRITPKFHASTQIEYGNRVIVVDPIGFATWTKKADIILITHSHGDHLDLNTIAKLKKAGTKIIAPDSVEDTIETIQGVDVEGIEPSERETISANQAPYTDIVVQAVPMYNLVRGPQPGKKYHPKANEWTGFIITLGGKRLYFAGDTEVTPEMKALRNIDAAFLPMNLPYTMTPQEAAQGARAFKPKVVYPYHFRSPFNKLTGNEFTFRDALRGSGIQVRILDWYPAAAVKKATSQ
jgi:L-ascorbate metabolism protein UlaG (beta-lactamase superfamily)